MGVTQMDERVAVTYEIIGLRDARQRELPYPGTWESGPPDDHLDNWHSGVWRCENGEPVEFIGDDLMEVEDAILRRDWRWVAPALKAAYELGRTQGMVQGEDFHPDAVFEGRAKGLLARRMNKSAEHLAYDVWHYEKPNREAVDSALNHIARAVESLKAVGITLTVGGEPQLTDRQLVTVEGLRIWGSDCCACGNATAGSQKCDVCGKSKYTVPLYVVDHDEDVATALAEKEIR